MNEWQSVYQKWSQLFFSIKVYVAYDKILIILTRRALTNAEGNNSNFPTTVMLFNVTVFEMKINKQTSRNVTQFLTD